ncbi:MAG: hypothetical protein JWL86_1850 [Rhizobium sp.]|nr:hypothetical protein [Rhizobium sp.]
MKKFVLAAAAALLLATTAQAADVKFPSADPEAVITVPDGWTAKEVEGTLDIDSPGDSVYLNVETATPADAADTLKAQAKWLDTQGITGVTQQGEVTKGDVNGMPLVTIDMNGVDKDGPVSIMLAIVTINSETATVFTYWGARGEEDKYREAVIAMIRSIKAAE